jgi:hypothetical protein
MIIDIVSHSVESVYRIKLDDETYDTFTTGDLYEEILFMLEVKLTEFHMYYNGNKFLDRDFILCKDIFNNDKYAKIYIYPKMNTSINNYDHQGYNYNDYMEDDIKEEILCYIKKSQKRATVKKVRKKMFINNPYDEEHIQTKMKMDNILLRLKK